MLVELPSGDWVEVARITGIRQYEMANNEHGISIDMPDQIGHFFVRFENEAAAKAWAKEFGAQATAAQAGYIGATGDLGLTKEAAAELGGFRDVIIGALNKKGLTVTGAGVGFGQADVSFELPDGRSIEVSLRFLT